MKFEFESVHFSTHLEKAMNDAPLAHFSLTDFDRLLDGVRPRLTIISGEPGTGKTSLLLQMADDLARQGIPVLFVSLEISPVQLVAKSLARLSAGKLAVADIATAGSKALAGNPTKEATSETTPMALAFKCTTDIYKHTVAPHIAFVTNADAVTIGALIAQCEQQVGRRPVVFLDYVQALTGDATDADERLVIKGIAASLRQTVNTYEVPLFAISSVNRTSYNRPVTDLSCLGGSSAVEYSSDVVAFLAVEGKGDERRLNLAQPVRPLRLTILKNRYGTCGEVTLQFDAEHATFKERG